MRGSVHEAKRQCAACACVGPVHPSVHAQCAIMLNKEATRFLSSKSGQAFAFAYACCRWWRTGIVWHHASPCHNSDIGFFQQIQSLENFIEVGTLPTAGPPAEGIGGSLSPGGGLRHAVLKNAGLAHSRPLR